MFDFVVIGAGPAGSNCSSRLSTMGYKTLQLEEHNTVGKPVECTGLVSRRVTDMVKTSSIVNRVHGANVFFPGGDHISIGKEEETLVLERDRFDQDVAAKTVASGTELRLNARVLNLERGKDSIKVTIRDNGTIKEVNCLAVVGADGSNSITRKILFPTQRFKRIVSAYQIEGLKRLEDQDRVNVYLGSEFSRGYFGWNTPAGDFSRLGTAGFGMTREKFMNLYRKFMNPDKVTITGGPIPISYLKKPYDERAILVGDAAGIVKPLSGGGIYTGMVSGDRAAETLNKAYENEDFTARSLSLYNRLWKKSLGKELFRDYYIQKLYARISDAAFDRIGKAISSPNMKEIISRIGDIDYPSRVVLSMMLRKPSILKNVLLPGKKSYEK